MIWVVKCDCQRVSEYCRCLSKCDSVFLDVLSCLLGVPFKFHIRPFTYYIRIVTLSQLLLRPNDKGEAASTHSENEAGLFTLASTRLLGFSIFIKLAMSYLVQLGQYQQFETLAVLVVYSLCSARLNSYHGPQDKAALLFFLSWTSEFRIDF